MSQTVINFIHAVVLTPITESTVTAAAAAAVAAASKVHGSATRLS
jgi:hypothetical protein